MIDRMELYNLLLPHLVDPKGPVSGGRYWSYCPAHDDGKKHGRNGPGLAGRSLSLHPRYGLTCFAGCEFEQIMEGHLGPDWRSRFSSNGHSPKERQMNEIELVEIYEYRDEDGALIAEKGRFRQFNGRSWEKTFRWRMAGSEKWGGLSNLQAEQMPLYGTEKVKEWDPDEWIYFCEGEKAVRACWEHGLPAVCTGFGAQGWKRASRAVSVLKGRKVAIWPDNDPPGFEFAEQMRGILRPICKEVRIVTVPVPAKGDAWDYFNEMGGTAEDLRKQTSTTPIVTYPSEHEVHLTIPKEGYQVEIVASDIYRARHTLECVVSIQGLGIPWKQRINLYSSTARTNAVRELNNLYGRQHEFTAWFMLLLDAIEQSAASIVAHVDVRDALDSGEVVKSIPYLVEELVPLQEPVMLYGMGGSGKSYWAMHLGRCVAAGEDFLGQSVIQAPVLWLDWEQSQDRFLYRVHRMEQGDQLQFPRQSFLYRQCTEPIFDLWDYLDTTVKHEGVGLVIIDSAAYACGMALKDEGTVAQYFLLLRRLKCSSLTIGHLNAEEDPRKPFGSIFWVNAPRATWYAFRAPSSAEEQTIMGLQGQKRNDGAVNQRFAVRIIFDDPDGPVTLKPVNPALVANWDQMLKPLAKRQSD